MIYEVTGDIRLSRAAVIVHGVAPSDPFHSGLALQLREQFPAMYKDFRHYVHQCHPKPGELWAWSGAGPNGPVTIVALLTQEGGFEHGDRPGRASLVNVSHALKALRNWIDQERPASVAVPCLATGVGGLKWTDVAPLVRQHLGSAGVPVFLYTQYRKGERAEEAVHAGKA